MEGDDTMKGENANDKKQTQTRTQERWPIERPEWSKKTQTQTQAIRMAVGVTDKGVSS